MSAAETVQPELKRLYGRTPQGLAGQLLKESQFVWRYDSTDPATALALAMPLRAATYSSTPLPAVFAMNLPEGRQADRLHKRFAKTFAKFDDMAILSLTGANPIGRNQLSIAPEPNEPVAALMSLAQLTNSTASAELFEYLANTYATTAISGVQPKVVVPEVVNEATGESISRATGRAPDLIVKTGGNEYPYLSQNEFVCMEVARRAGLQVPEFHLGAGTSPNSSLFIMRRFDQAAGQRLGMEDFAVLANVNHDPRGRYKYQGSYEAVAKLIALYCSQNQPHQQLELFFGYFALSCLLRNGDGHLKNYALLYNNPADLRSVRMSPVYDVVTTSVYDFEDRYSGRVYADRRLALRLNKSTQYPSREALIAFGRSHCMVQRPQDVIEKILDAKRSVAHDHFGSFSNAFAQRMTSEWLAAEVQSG